MTDNQTTGQDASAPEETRQPSDARVILGPLVKYAAVGSVLVGIIITTAVMLDREFNTIDQQIADLEAELAEAHRAAEPDSSNTYVDDIEIDTIATAEKQPEMSMTVPDPVTRIEADETATDGNDGPGPLADTKPAVPVLVENANSPTIVPDVRVDAVTADESATNTPAGTWPANRLGAFDQSLNRIIADRNAYLNERDRQFLEDIRASQQRQLQLMRDRLTWRERRIQAMEQRYRELNNERAADMKRMQKQRALFFPDRI